MTERYPHLAYQDQVDAARAMLAALEAAVASPMNVAVATTDVSRNMRAAIAAAKAAGIKTEERK